MDSLDSVEAEVPQARVFWPVSSRHSPLPSQGFLVGWNLRSFVACVATVIGGVPLNLIEQAVERVAAHPAFRQLHSDARGVPTVLGEWSDMPTSSSSTRFMNNSHNRRVVSASAQACALRKATSNLWLTMRCDSEGRPFLKEIHCCGYRYHTTLQLVFYRRPRSLRHGLTLRSINLDAGAEFAVERSLRLVDATDMAVALEQINAAPEIDRALRRYVARSRRRGLGLKSESSSDTDDELHIYTLAVSVPPPFPGSGHKSRRRSKVSFGAQLQTALASVVPLLAPGDEDGPFSDGYTSSDLSPASTSPVAGGHYTQRKRSSVITSRGGGQGRRFDQITESGSQGLLIPSPNRLPTRPRRKSEPAPGPPLGAAAILAGRHGLSGSSSAVDVSRPATASGSTLSAREPRKRSSSVGKELSASASLSTLSQDQLTSPAGGGLFCAPRIPPNLRRLESVFSSSSRRSATLPPLSIGLFLSIVMPPLVFLLMLLRILFAPLCWLFDLSLGGSLTENPPRLRALTASARQFNWKLWFFTYWPAQWFSQYALREAGPPTTVSSASSWSPSSSSAEVSSRKGVQARKSRGSSTSPGLTHQEAPGLPPTLQLKEEIIDHHKKAPAKGQKIRKKQILGGIEGVKAAARILAQNVTPHSYRTVTIQYTHSIPTIDDTVRSVRFYNHMLVLALDVFLGMTMALFLWGYTDHIVRFLRTFGHSLTDGMMRTEIKWLMGWPAGLKLNESLNNFYGSFFLFAIDIWAKICTFLSPIAPAFLTIAVIAGFGGLTMSLSLVADVMALLTLHVTLFYTLSAMIYRVQRSWIFSMANLFQGKKKNLLRNRIDHCDFSVDQLLLGTLVFTIAVALLPTTAVYYLFFTFLRFLVLWIQDFISVLCLAVNELPVAWIAVYLWRPSLLPGGVWIDCGPGIPREGMGSSRRHPLTSPPPFALWRGDVDRHLHHSDMKSVRASPAVTYFELRRRTIAFRVLFGGLVQVFRAFFEHYDVKTLVSRVWAGHTLGSIPLVDVEASVRRPGIREYWILLKVLVRPKRKVKGSSTTGRRSSTSTASSTKKSSAGALGSLIPQSSGGEREREMSDRLRRRSLEVHRPSSAGAPSAAQQGGSSSSGVGVAVGAGGGGKGAAKVVVKSSSSSALLT